MCASARAAYERNVMPGPNPTPKAINELRGNPGKRTKRAAEPSLPPGVPKPPAEVKGTARTEYLRLAPDLEAAGVLTTADWGTFAQMCVYWSEWRLAQRHLNNEGRIQERDKADGTGTYTWYNPWASIRDKAYDNYQKAARELGITPASRSRVSAVKPKSAVNPWAALKGGRKSG